MCNRGIFICAKIVCWLHKFDEFKMEFFVIQRSNSSNTFDVLMFASFSSNALVFHDILDAL